MLRCLPSENYFKWNQIEREFIERRSQMSLLAGFEANLQSRPKIAQIKNRDKNRDDSLSDNSGIFQGRLFAAEAEQEVDNEA